MLFARLASGPDPARLAETISGGLPVIGSLMRLLPGLLNQNVARSNAHQADVRLTHRRQQREEVDAYLARLPASPMDSPT
jgi:hypothetical protein